MSEQKQNIHQKISMRPYKPGDEDRIIDFLNFSYPRGWGDIRMFEWMYTQYPTFKKDGMFTFEIDGEIVGHRGLLLRDLCISGSKLCIGQFTNTAVHSDFRGLGIYTRLHEATIQAARSKNACMFISTSSAKGGITYKHNKKTGFAEIKRGACYWKILNCQRVFKNEIREFIRGDYEMMSLVRDLKDHLYLAMGDSLFSIAEIIGEEPGSTKPKKRVEVVFAETAFPLMQKFRSGSKIQNVITLFSLVLSRKMKIRVTSLGLLFKVASKGVRIIV